MTNYGAFYSLIEMTENGRDVVQLHHPMTVKRGERPGNNQGRNDDNLHPGPSFLLSADT